MKTLAQSRAAKMAAGTLLAAHMALVKRTTRWRVLGAEHRDAMVAGREGVIVLTWHSRFSMLNASWRRGWQMPHVMISRSRDGDIVHYTSRALGLQTIRGSSRKAGSTKVKGGGRAAAEALVALEGGGCVVITPDGPRGPRQRLQIGALRLARTSGAPILPCAFAVSRRRTFSSWDRTVLPKLFGRGVILWGEPLVVPESATDAELERMRAELEARMNADLAQADGMVGHPVSEPAEMQA